LDGIGQVKVVSLRALISRLMDRYCNYSQPCESQVQFYCTVSHVSNIGSRSCPYMDFRVGVQGVYLLALKS
jgi:hypothetical protein